MGCKEEEEMSREMRESHREREKSGGLFGILVEGGMRGKERQVGKKRRRWGEKGEKKGKREDVGCRERGGGRREEDGGRREREKGNERERIGVVGRIIM